MEYDFTLKFKLSGGEQDADAVVERLGETGCDDALVGTGISGRIALDFIRVADSAHEAVASAIVDVVRALPHAELVEVGPDFVGLSDVAEMVGVSRQYLRKLRLENSDFPAAVHEGKQSFWHLADVLFWLRKKKEYDFSQELMATAKEARRVNADIEAGLMMRAFPTVESPGGEKQIFGDHRGLQFELIVDEGVPGDKVRGGLRILLDGKPVWFEEDLNGQKMPLVCDWVALLAFLSENWPWLVLEEDYPLPVPILHPSFILQDAEFRWRELSKELVVEEQSKVHTFLGRHDLAEIFRERNFASLILLRQGRTCHISVGSLTLIKPWAEVQNTLESVGEYLATVIATGRGKRALRTVDSWHSRGRRLAEKELDLTSGLTPELRERLPGVDWQAAEIRAVARMSRRDVVMAEQKVLLDLIAGVPHKQTPELDRLADTIMQEFREEGLLYEQGYWAAERLRLELSIGEHDDVDPEEYLRQWGVTIEEFELPVCPVEAVTAWGERHGPVVLINRSASSKAGHEYGRRATLAHEIAHLVLDRNRALPAGEVLGGSTPEYPEKRARAFAAEFLMPRSAAAWAVRNHSSLEEAARYLQSRYRVSTELLAWQIHNSGVVVTLGHEEQVRLEQWKNGRLTVIP